MAGLLPTPVVDVELAGVGAGWTNLGQGGSKDVLMSYGVSVVRGITSGGPNDNVAPTGVFSYALNNSASNSAGLLGYYSLYNANKRSGWALGIRCRLTLIDPTTATSRVRFIGRVDAIDPIPGKQLGRAVRVTVVDWMDEAARWAITSSVGGQVGKSWDQILTAILAQMPFQPTATSLDVGGEAYPYALDTSAFAEQPALSEFKKLADSERGLVYVKADGTFKAEGRHTRLLTTTTAWTIAETDFNGLTMPSTRDDVMNTFRVTIHPREVDALATSIVYAQANVIEIAPSGTKLLLGRYRDAVTGLPIGATELQTLTPGLDYIANTKSNGSGTNVTSDLSFVVQAGPAGVNLQATSVNTGTIYLTFLQVRGRGIRDNATLMLQASDATSVTVNGEHVVSIDMPYQANSDIAQGAANYYRDKYSTAFAIARTVSVPGRSTSVVTQILQRDISDRIALSETVTGLNNAFFINGEELRVHPTGTVSVVYHLAPAADPFNGLYWIIDTSVLGTGTLPAPF